MSDMAETIRQAFTSPVTIAPPFAFPALGSGQVPPLEVSTQEPPHRFEAQTLAAPPLASAQPVVAPMLLSATVRGEPGWEAWGVEAEVCQLPLFSVEKTQRMAVPALPERADVRRVGIEGMPTRSRSGWSDFKQPSVRSFKPQWAFPESFGALRHILELPVAFIGEDLQKLSKALLMRYTLQLVRSTGQNIRNLEILGLYHIPSKGARQVRHDATTGRLLVNLGPESRGSQRAPFIIARQKDDHSVVCCYLEET